MILSRSNTGLFETTCLLNIKLNNCMLGIIIKLGYRTARDALLYFHSLQPTDLRLHKAVHSRTKQTVYIIHCSLYNGSNILF